MTKNQKIWMWIFVVMFALPEILWSSIANFYYEFFQSGKISSVVPFRYSFLQNLDNLIYLKIILTVQTIGIFLLLISIYKNANFKNALVKYLLALLLFVLFVVSVFALYFVLSFGMNIM